MKLAEIAARIDAHLKRFEADPNINGRDNWNGPLRYFNASAAARGKWVYVCYVLYHGSRRLVKTEAAAYLNWLDAGNVGKHWDMENERQAAGSE